MTPIASRRNGGARALRGVRATFGAILIACGPWSGAAALAQGGPHGAASEFLGASYVAPAGWQEQSQSSFRALIAPAARPGQLLMVMVRAAQPATPNAETELMALADAAEANGRRLARGSVESAQRSGLRILSVMGRVDQAPAGEHLRIYQLVTDGRTSVFVMTLAKGDETFAAQREALLGLIQSVHPSSAPAPAAVTAGPGGAAGVAPAGAIPYGGKPVNVLDRDFRPSGSGQPIPLPAIVGGAPVGLWWYLKVSSYGTGVQSYVFLPDGRATALFRPGGPMLVDLDGMRALGEDGFIGRYQVADGALTVTWGRDGRDTISRPLTIKSSGGQPYFLWFQREYQPAMPLDRRAVVGRWRQGAMGTFDFRADGTVVTTANMIDSQRGGASGRDVVTGTWSAEGYLLALRFPQDGDRVYPAFLTTNGTSLVVRQSLLSRE